MKKIYLIIASISLILAMITVGCNSSPGAVTCNTTSTEFQQIENALVAGGMSVTNVTFCDMKELIFSVSSPRTICKIGFKGNDSAYIMNQQYRINVYNTSGSILYTNTQLMSPIGEYHSLTMPINLVTNSPYIIRVQLVNPPITPYHNQFECIQNNGNVITYPRTAGVASILGSGAFYGSLCNNPGADFYLPKIDVVFQ